MFAGKQGDAVNHLQGEKAKDKVSLLCLAKYLALLAR